MNEADTLLREPSVLALDCQSTGANPDKGHLLEIGWAQGEGESLRGATALVVRLPADVEIPARVRALTGIGPEQLESALEPLQAWEALVRAAAEAAGQAGLQRAFTLIHHSQFELPFLRQLHARHAAGQPFPLNVVCTRQIARKLLPELPRCGLRALVGYFGLRPPELRRSAEHVAATLFVWRQLVERLESDCGLKTFGQLFEWIDQPAQRKCRRVYPMPREQRLALADAPGVYRFRRRNGDLLYVGKATSLRKRVNSYFQKQSHLAERSLEMLTQAHGLDSTPTATALEAALLESDEIKQHAPPYNVALRANNRQLCFASTDLRALAGAPRSDSCLGPFPSERLLKPVFVLCELLRGGATTLQNAEQVLNVSPQWLPTLECFSQGVLLFGKEFLQTGRPLEIEMIRLGAALWRERLAELARQELEPEEDETWELESQTEISIEWTAQAVVEALKQVALRLAHQLRRACWLCNLSECSLAWTERENLVRRVLVFERGDISQRNSLEHYAPLPLPPGHSKSVAERQQSFDLATYDRLSVLSMELRRLLSKNTEVSLHLKAGQLLTGQRVARVLRWL